MAVIAAIVLRFVGALIAFTGLILLLFGKGKDTGIGVFLFCLGFVIAGAN
ncbi:MAG: hypothetical protein J6A04_07030 [Clostridia bacterium]|nr:hypothetical protein [Clostridia bacterium]